MVYISSWQEYQEAAESLYLNSPNKVSICASYGTQDQLNLCIRCQARYCVKWKPSDGKLVLKITDDTTVCTCTLSCRTNDQLRMDYLQCLKYQTHSSIFLNRFEALNLSLMQKMQNRRPPVAAEPFTSLKATIQVDDSRAGTPTPGGSSATPAASGVAGGGVKKKKGGKKKK